MNNRQFKRWKKKLLNGHWKCWHDAMYHLQSWKLPKGHPTRLLAIRKIFREL